MGCALVDAARASRVPGTETSPRVRLRLTRLREAGPDVDPRIPRTVQALHDLGIVVEMGERELVIPPTPDTSAHEPELLPTTHVNLDLSVLVALVSDCSHSGILESVDAAKARFPFNIGKRGQLLAADAEESELCSPIHLEQLSAQAVQEMSKGLIEELASRLTSPGTSPTFWTTPEARERCLRIVDKIGGDAEKRRARALLIDEDAEAYWRDSRYPEGYLGVLPVRNLTSTSGPQLERESTPFFTQLVETCDRILSGPEQPEAERQRDEIERARKAGGECFEILWDVLARLTTRSWQANCAYCSVSSPRRTTRNDNSHRQQERCQDSLARYAFHTSRAIYKWRHNRSIVDSSGS